MRREYGFYPMSVATSLAIEGLSGTGERETTNIKFNLKPFKSLYVNLRTLVRNATGSYPYDVQPDLKTKELVAAVVQDYEGICKHVSEDLQIVPYLCTQKSLNSEFKGKFRRFETPRQNKIFELEESAIKTLYNTYGEDITKYDITLKGDSRSICLTHQPIDLLSANKFPELVLLESHTGLLKDDTQWPSKLKTLKDKTHMPFNKITLQVFGDNNMFLAQPQKIREVLESIGVKKRWSSATSQSSFLLDVRNAYEPHLYKLLQSLE